MRLGSTLLELYSIFQDSNWLTETYSGDNVFEFLAHIDLVFISVREDYATSSNENAKLMMTLVQEGRSACRHFIE
jgi:hypothetical protein